VPKGLMIATFDRLNNLGERVAEVGLCSQIVGIRRHSNKAKECRNKIKRTGNACSN